MSASTDPPSASGLPESPESHGSDGSTRPEDTLTEPTTTSPRDRSGKSRRPAFDQLSVGAVLDVDDPVVLDRPTRRRPAGDATDSKGSSRGDGTTASTGTGLLRRGDAQKYLLIDDVATGGMGAVFRVLDTDIRREIAMKVMLDESTDRPRMLRFLEEVQVTGQLEHPNIVPVHDVGLDRDGNLFFTMKLVQGEPLSTIVNRLRAGRPYRGLNALNRRLEVFLKVCDAVAFAHSRKVIHRDIKPSNVMVGEYGEVLLMDWGLARVIGRPDRQPRAVRTDRREDGQATRDGTIAGTPNYMPPEQARGEIDVLDERADIYALGALLYELLTLEIPVTAEMPYEVVRKVVAGEVTPPRERAPDQDIPRELDAIVRKAMNPRKAGRFRNVPELQAEVQAWIDGRTLTHVSYTGWQRAGKWIGRNRPFVAGVLATLAFMAVAAFFAFDDLRRTRQAERQAAHIEGRGEVLASIRRGARANALQLDASVSAWADATQAHQRAMAAWRAARAALGPHPAPHEMGESWSHWRVARDAAFDAMAAAEAGSSQGVRALARLAAAQGEDDESHGQLRERIEAQVARLMLWDAPPIDPVMRARLAPALEGRIAQRFNRDGEPGRAVTGDALVSLDADAPAATGPVRVHAFRFVDASLVGGEPRRVPLPISRHDGLASGIRGSALLAQPLAAWVAHSWSGTDEAYALLGELPLQDLRVGPGEWLMQLRWQAGGLEREQLLPLSIPPDVRLGVHVRLPSGASAGLTLPAVTLVEQPMQAGEGEGLTRTQLPAVGIQPHEVTAGAWLEFLNSPAVNVRSLVQQGRVAALLPRSTDGRTRWHIGTSGRVELPTGVMPGQPVTGISPRDAIAYAEWLSASTPGRRYRLPTDAEWSRAAGPWRYTWGDWPEPAWAWVNRDRPADVTADSGDAAWFALDESVWQVRGLCGNVREWCTGAVSTFVIRGGSYATCTGGPDTVVEMAMTVCQPATATTVRADTGFRLVWTLE